MANPPEIRVVGAAVVRDGRVLACRRGPGQRQAGMWEFPGGKVEPGETDPEALARELYEELRIRVQVQAFLGEGVHHYAHATVRLMVYGCRLAGGRPQLQEHDAVRWLLPSQLGEVAWAPPDVPVLAAVGALLIAPD